MKFKTTRKQINQNFNSVICIAYCDAQYLLRGKNPIAYNEGYYGWNYDLYDINGVAIVTGYRPWGNIHPDYKIIKKYEDEARKIWCGSWGNYQNTLDQTDQLLNQFIREVTNDEE